MHSTNCSKYNSHLNWRTLSNGRFLGYLIRKPLVHMFWITQGAEISPEINVPWRSTERRGSTRNSGASAGRWGSLDMSVPLALRKVFVTIAPCGPFAMTPVLLPHFPHRGTVVKTSVTAPQRKQSK